VADEMNAGISTEGPDLLTQGLGAGDNQTGGTAAGQGTTATPETKVEHPAWMDQLTDDLKGNESLTKFTKVADLGKSYIELEGRLGKSVAIPGEDASDEDRAAFREKMGIPKEAAGYELKALEGVPDYIQKSLAGSEESLRKRLLEAGVSQTAAKEIYGWMQEELKIGDDALGSLLKERAENAEKELRAEWKGDYEKNLNIMSNGLRRFADPAFIEKADKMGWSRDPDFCRIFHKVGMTTSEDTLITGGDEQIDDFDPQNHVLTF